MGRKPKTARENDRTASGGCGGGGAGGVNKVLLACLVLCVAALVGTYSKSAETCRSNDEGGRRDLAYNGRYSADLKLSDDEGLSLNLCSAQMDANACQPHLAEFEHANFTTRQFSAHVQAGIPFVLRGAVSHVRRTAEDVLKAVPDDLASQVSMPQKGSNGEVLTPIVYMFLRDMLKLPTRPLYAPQFPCSSLSDPTSEFLSSTSLPTFVMDVLGESDVCNLWLANDAHEKSTTLLHYDHSHNLYLQASATKRFTLLPPHRRSRLAPYRALSGVMQSGARQEHAKILDVPNAEHRKVELPEGVKMISHTTKIEGEWSRPQLFHNVPGPAQSAVRDKVAPLSKRDMRKMGLMVTLRPGDLLYLPPFWWHEVETLGASVSINHWWNSQGIEDFIMKKLDNIASFEERIQMPPEQMAIPAGGRPADDSGRAPWMVPRRYAQTSPELASAHRKIAKRCEKTEGCSIVQPQKKGLGPSWDTMIQYFVKTKDQQK